MASLKNIGVSIASLGDNTVIAAVAGSRIWVFRLVLANNVATAQAIQVKDGASTVLMPITGNSLSLPSTIGGQLILADASNMGDPWFKLVKGNALIINLSAATAVNGYIQYKLMPS